MQNKDPKIEYELKSLSDRALPDADKILSKARAEMRREKPAKKRVFTARRFFVAAAAVAAVILAIVLGSGIAGLFLPNKTQPGGAPSGITYAATDLYARPVDYFDAERLFAETYGADAVFPVPAPDGETEEGNPAVASLRLYVCKNTHIDRDVAIIARLRFSGGEYGNDELTMYFELTNDTLEENGFYLRLPSSEYGVALKESYEDGEYVTYAYIENKYRCMLSVMNGNEYRTEYYLRTLFGITAD